MFTIENNIKIIEELKLNNKKIVLTNGCFDILHRGHVDYLKQSSKQGDYLFVGINSDRSIKQLKGDKRPINKELDRAYLISELKCVCGVFIFNELNFSNCLGLLKPSCWTKGEDYNWNNIHQSERNVCVKNNINIKFLPYVVNGMYSTTSIINNINNIT